MIGIKLDHHISKFTIPPKTTIMRTLPSGEVVHLNCMSVDNYHHIESFGDHWLDLFREKCINPSIAATQIVQAFEIMHETAFIAGLSFQEAFAALVEIQTDYNATFFTRICERIEQGI